MMGAPISVPRRLLDIDEYYRLGEAGVLGEDDRIELIEGEMIEMAPIGGPHMHLVNALTRVLSTQLGDTGLLSVQNPIALPPRNVPQPDLAILKAECRNRRDVPGAKDVLLLIEVAHTTLEYDRDVKVPIYAAHDIPQVWLFDCARQSLSIYLEPTSTGFTRVLTPGNDETVAPSMLPDVKVRISELW